MNVPRFPRLLTAKQVAGRLGISPMGVYRLARSGDLPAHRIGRSVRFDPAEVEWYLEGTRITPREDTA